MGSKKGSTVGSWLAWMLVGILAAMGLLVVLVHVADVRVEKQRQYREECYERGPRDRDGEPVCDRDFMPAYTSSGPYFRASAGAPSGS